MRGKILVLTGLLIVGIYAALSLAIDRNFFRATGFHYYNYQINALIHGRLDLISPNIFDLSLYQGKWYMYWGPAPTLFVLPFYLVGRLEASDVLYTMVAAILGGFWFLLAAKEAARFFKIKLTEYQSAFLWIAYALVSPLFFLAVKGAIWQTNQTVAGLYAVGGLWALFRYLNRRRLAYLALAAILVNLAWLSRYTMVFYLLLFLYPPYLSFTRKNIRSVIREAAVVGSITLIFFLAFFGYNYLRFGKITETGMRYQKGHIRYDKDIRENRILSLKNIGHNAYYYFLNPLGIKLGRPYIIRDMEGNSVFFTYPVLFLLLQFADFKTFLKAREKIFLALAAIVTVLILAILMLSVGTGWVQFGNRYFFDTVPLLYLAFLFILPHVSPKVWYPALTVGLLVNVIGLLAHHFLLI